MYEIIATYPQIMFKTDLDRHFVEQFNEILSRNPLKTQGELLLELGSNTAAIGQIKRGRQSVTVGMLENFRKRYGASIDAMIDGKNAVPKGELVYSPADRERDRVLEVLEAIAEREGLDSAHALVKREGIEVSNYYQYRDGRKQNIPEKILTLMMDYGASPKYIYFDKGEKLLPKRKKQSDDAIQHLRELVEYQASVMKSQAEEIQSLKREIQSLKS